ncbi:MAG: Actin- protein 10 [Vezdaea acicularis]|nr:MAG: Actin- protein 10 [Vezdaea acicularis]
MSTPTLSAIAAGVRNTLVVDIGWHETVATAVYEYREVQHTRSIKGAKALLQETGKLLVRHIRKAREWHEADGTEDSADDFAEDVSLEECEEVLTRLVWCRSRREALKARGGDKLSATSTELSHQFRSMHIAEDDTAGSVSLSLSNQPMSITLNSTRPPTVIQVPFFSLSSPTEIALFPHADDADDNELPIDLLVYQALRSLPVDVRGLCMSRIIICGGISRLPGIKWRIIEEVKALVDAYGWEKVRGRAADAFRQRLRERSQNSQAKHQAPTSGSFTKVSAAFEAQQRDPVEESLHRHNAKQGPRGLIRGIETLGPWTGASLLAGMKAKSVVQIEKEKFLQNGLAGASKEGEVPVAPQRMSVGPSGPRQGLASQSNWTLAGWA